MHDFLMRSSGDLALWTIIGQMEEISINIESGSMIQNEITHSKEGKKDVSCSISIEKEGAVGTLSHHQEGGSGCAGVRKLEYGVFCLRRRRRAVAAMAVGAINSGRAEAAAALEIRRTAEWRNGRITDLWNSGITERRYGCMAECVSGTAEQRSR